MGTPHISSIVDFLAAVKLAIAYDRCAFRGRPRTDQDLLDLNLTRKLALAEICRLTPANYSSGPRPDDTDQSREVWIFGLEIELNTGVAAGGVEVDSVEVYVKLRLNPTKPGEMPRATVWSFHRSDHPMRYPLRETR